ncbi:MAG: chitobiase/beta-hexosaminidase C-terminal domain-containing protein, partial [Bacteroidales bacterium]|nr:chitobiase/beta-hexosaminidase C-terminal domain-containing protein [Candidatus Minthousia equi]
MSGVKWTTSQAAYIGFTADKGVQIGSGNNPQNQNAWTISTSAFNQEGITITGVTLNLSVASSGGGTASVSIGGKQFDDVITLGTGNVNPQDISFSNGSYASGDITISLLSTKAKAMYIKSIKVVYDEGEQSVGKPTFSPKAGTYYSPQSVSLSAGSNANIYYTTDGSTPSASSTHYTAPFKVSTTTSVKAIAIEGDRSSEVSEATYTIAELPADAYMRVNNASELQEGDRLLFVGKVGETYYAMSEQSTNNRRSVMLTSADEVLAATSEGAEVFTLCKEEGHWIFMDKNNKYLASTGSGSNYRLQSISTKSPQTLADVSINTAGEATIFFTENAYKDDKGDTSMDGNPYMRFNQNRNGDTYNPLFSCYRTADSQQPVYIYRRPGEPVRDIPATPTFSLASGMYNEAQSTTIACETEGAVIHYTTDGTEPTAESPEYTSAIAFALDSDQAVRTTVKAIAVKKGVSSEMAVLKVTVNPFMYQYKAVKSEEGLVEGDTYIVLARDGEHAAGVVSETNYRIYAVAASADSYTFEGAVATLPLESPVAVYTLSGSEGAWVMTDKVGNLCLPNTDNTNVTYNRNATLRINFREGMAQISGQDGRLLTYRDRSVSEDVYEQVFR